MIHKIFKSIVVSITILTFSLGIFASAQDAAPASFNLLPFDCLIKTNNCTKDLASSITKFLFDLAPFLATLVLVYGGYLYFLGGFDQKSSGLKAIQAAVFGYVIIIIGYGISGEGDSLILNLVKNTLGGSDSSGINAAPIAALIQTITNILITLAGVAAVFIIVLGGYRFLFSGIPGVKEDGKQTILNGIIGLVVVLIARPIMKVITDTLSSQTNELNIQTNSITNTVVNIINGFLIPVSAVITVFFLVWAGFDWITSGGDSGKAGKAKEKLTNAIIGLVVVLLAVTISQLIVFFVGNSPL
jgi:hypothetical protein